jgi:DNA-binding transcriptional MerR regulator
VSDPSLTIGELASRTGLAVSALRYYEELGLMPPASRVSGQRRYPATAVHLVGTILLLREVGFSLREIRAFITSRSESAIVWRDLARRKTAELDQQIQRARLARGALRHALRCQHADILECPNFSAVVTARLAGASLHDAHAD